MMLVARGYKARRRWRHCDMKRKPKKRLPVVEKQCETCPFKKDSELSHLQSFLAASSIGEASRICHSTGSNNAINHRTGKPPMLCRGARDFQLQFFHRVGIIEAPTDEAWNNKCKELGIP